MSKNLSYVFNNAIKLPNKLVVQGSKLTLAILFSVLFSPANAQVFRELDINGSVYSLVVTDLDNGKDIISVNPNLFLTPASTLKIITTATTIDKFGENYKFTTSFFTNGYIQNGILNGDLIIKGAADPTLGSAFFSSTTALVVLQEIKQALNNSGIHSISGKIILDQSIINSPRYPARRLWEDMANYYGAAPSALTWRDNTFEVVLKSPAKVGELCLVLDVKPKQHTIEFVSFVTAAAHQRDSAYIFGYPGLGKWEVRGSIPANRNSFSIKGSLPFPELIFANEVVNVLDNQTSAPEITTHNNINYNNCSLLFSIESPQLSEIIKVVNQRSNNLMADHLFLAQGFDSFNAKDMWDNSAIEMSKYWQANNVNINMRIYDGSGLSPKNLITARSFVNILSYMNTATSAKVFESSLAIGGQTGTLARMWTQEKHKGRVVAKSGYIEGVLAYAGYIYTQSGKKMAFCFIVNNFISPLSQVRRVMEQTIGDVIEKY